MKCSLAAIVSGMLLWACFPPLDLGKGLVWVALAPLLWALWPPVGGEESARPLSGWRAFRLGWLAGYVFFLLNFNWLHTVTWPGMFVLPVYLGLFVAGWAAVAATVGRPRREGAFGAWARAAGVTAAAWTGLEWLRGWLFTGFGWNGLGVAMSGDGWFPQWAEWIGVTGLSFFIVLGNALVVGLFRAWRRSGTGEVAGAALVYPAKLAVAGVLGGVVLMAGGAWLRDRAAAWPVTPLPVALVQPNIPQAIKNDPDEFYPIATTLAELTTRAMETVPPPSLIVWPESSLPTALSDPTVTGLLEEGAQLGEFTHILGIDDHQLDAFYNALVMFRGDPSQAQVYHKVHLVPFGEFVPLASLMERLRWLVPELPAGSFDVGDVTDPLPLPPPDAPAQIIPLVCFEDTVGRVARKFVRPASQAIINVTNDGWFLDSEAADQHLENAVFRCLELRRPMARATNTGATAVIDVTGRVTAALPRLEEGVLRATLPMPAVAEGGGPAGTMTLYARVGDAFSLALLGVTAAGVAGHVWGRRRRSGHG